jgi:hypothetical protein
VVRVLVERPLWKGTGEETLRMIKAQIGEYLGEDDTEPVEDDWRRGETGSNQGADV